MPVRCWRRSSGRERRFPCIGILDGNRPRSRRRGGHEGWPPEAWGASRGCPQNAMMGQMTVDAGGDRPREAESGGEGLGPLPAIASEAPSPGFPADEGSDIVAAALGGFPHGRRAEDEHNLDPSVLAGRCRSGFSGGRRWSERFGPSRPACPVPSDSFGRPFGCGRRALVTSQERFGGDGAGGRPFR